MKIEFDDGYAFGKGAFETIRVVDGKPLFLEDHLKRLDNSLKFFDIKRNIDEKKIYEYIDKSANKNFALKIIVSDKNFILTSRDDNYKNNYKSFKLNISKMRRNSTSKLIYHKSLCYYENILEHKLAQSKGYDSALFLNEKEDFSETAFANIFFIKNNEIFTPPISSGLLKGTMRDYLIKNYNIIEKEINISEIMDFDEVFISNSLMGIRNVASIDDIKFEKDKISREIFNELKKLGF